MKKKFFIAFILSFICFSFMYTSLWKTISEKPTIAAPNGEDPDSNSDIGNKVEPKIKNEILFLMMGVDTKDVKDSKGTRTDTMMLTRINFETGEIRLLSIPRDTRVPVRGKEDKINHAHAFGGPSLTIESVRNFLNIDLDYYVKVDYRIVKGIVDAIGGVEIDVPRRMKYDDTTAGLEFHVDLKKGLQTLDGDQAIQFIRWRQNNDGTGYPEGDVGRIKTQQYFMKELIKQTLKAKNIVKLPKLVDTYFDNVETNIPLSVVLKGIGLASKINMETMETATIPGEGKIIGVTDYWIYDREVTRQIVEGMFGDYLLD